MPLEQMKEFENEILPEFIRNLEELPLTADDKMNLLLTKAGLKPASEINLIIKSWYEGGITEHMTDREVQETIDIIKESGLLFQLGEKIIEKESYQTEKEPSTEKFYEREQMKVLISRSKENLDFLIEALKTKSDELLGKAFGFPQTAIEAFVDKREKLDIGALPKEVRESDAVLFSSPIISKDNWQEEIKQGQIYADFIKKVSPKIYKEMKTLSLTRE